MTAKNWRNPKVGQTNFSIELEASGGYPPYNWELAIGGEPKAKLDWLILKEDESDNNKAKAWLTNKAGLGPTQTTEISDTLEIKVTVRDNTKQGQDDRLDNKGATWVQKVTIEDCSTFVTCENDNGCCPSGCNIGNDNDCPARCGDGFVTLPELCDTGIIAGLGGACDTQDTCNDQNPCTIDRVENADTCQAKCVSTLITECKNDDNCCPDGCNNSNDNNCSATCGNNIVETNETCDGNCPTSCDDGNACTTDSMTGSANNCNVVCGHQAIMQCKSGDGCCPTGCHHDMDTDCACKCGDGYVDGSCGETCDGNCPSNCDDGNKCTTDSLTGTAATCNVVCTHTAIHPCCGDGLVEGTETCDGNCSSITCPDEGNKCTNEVLTGNAATCDVACTHPAIVPCCGNGVVESGETCDGNCPSNCDDGNKCTTDSLTGTAATCNVVCTHTAIHPCCGDGLVEGTETCDGNCSSITCPDEGNKCTNEVLTGNAATCDVACTHPAVTCTGCGSCNSANGNCEANQTKCSSGQICGSQNSCGPCTSDQQCISGYGVGYVCKNGVCGKGSNPLLHVIGGDMSAYYENIDVYRDGVAIADAQVTANGTIIPNKSGGWYYGTLSSSLPVGATIILQVKSGTSTVTATGIVPERPVQTAPSNNSTFKSTDNITVTWTSSTNPDYFRVSATYSCGTNCGTGKDFEAVGAARTLTIPAGSLPTGLTILIRVFPYNNGSYTGDYTAGDSMHIRADPTGMNIIINP